MRDIIWTIIVVWIVWKIYDAFTSLGKSRAHATGNRQQSYSQQNYQQQQTKREGEVRVDKAEPQTSHFKPDDGEYVDYEEIK